MIGFALFLALGWVGGVGTLFAAQRKILYPSAGPANGIWDEPVHGYREVSFPTSDGLVLRSLYAPSRGRKSILFLHGNGDTAVGSTRILQPYVEQGYGALIVEFRGYAGNPGSPTEAGLYADGDGAFGWLEQNGVDPRDLIVMGYSLGTGIASRISAREPVAATVMIAPYTSIDDVAWGHFPFLPTARLTKDRYPTKDRFRDIRSPILLVHGRDDRTIPFANSLSLARLNERAAVRIVPAQGHTIAYHAVAAETVLDWLHHRRL